MINVRLFNWFKKTVDVNFTISVSTATVVTIFDTTTMPWACNWMM